MSLDPHTFMSTLEKRICLTSEDKNLLKSQADWGLEVASDMADYFYAYLGRDPEMSAILHDGNERIHRLRETFIQWFHEMFTGMDNWGNAYAERYQLSKTRQQMMTRGRGDGETRRFMYCQILEKGYKKILESFR